MFNDMNQEDIAAFALNKGLNEYEAGELATLATQRCVDSSREDFARYWHLVEKLGK